MKTFGIGVLGFGTVGAGVVEGLQTQADLLSHRLGLRLALRAVADLDVTSDRGVAVDPALLTTDAEAVVDDPRVDVVVELIGGTGAARALIERALTAGKPVVTANKALLAQHGDALLALSKKHRADLFYEAAVGGGIPIIRALREGLVANQVECIYAILNGTCNYILSRMAEEGMDFDTALAEAQAAGFAEADPGLDIDGSDTAHKAAILASLAYGFPVPLEKVHVEGLRGLQVQDLNHARELGYCIKLLAVIRQAREGVEVRVHPSLVRDTHMLASVTGVFNAVLVRGDVVGDTLYYGCGAGRRPTASAVLGDVAEAARNLAFDAPGRVPAWSRHPAGCRLLPITASCTRYYLRLSLRDTPGTLAAVARILGARGISIDAVFQKDRTTDQHAAVLFLTSKACERDMDAALEEIACLPQVNCPAVRFRIADMD